MAATASVWKKCKDGLSIRVRLTPRASTDAIGAVEETAEGPALAARVRAAPSEGEANAALEKLLAKWLGVPKNAVAVARGHKSRVKLLTVAGDPVVLEKGLIETLVQSGAGKST